MIGTVRRGAGELLELPVRHRGVVLGRPVDAILDESLRRVLGLVVVCRDQAHRFLPLAAATVAADEIALDSPLLLLEERELAYYTLKGSRLGSLVGTIVVRRGAALGVLDDLVIADDGVIEEVRVSTSAGMRSVLYDAKVGFSAVRRASAAR
jgi:hypothetical protein